MLAFIVGLTAEASLLRPLNARVFVGNGTSRGAVLATARALQAGAQALISFGLAGGLSPGLEPGAIIVPKAVLLRGRHMATDPALSNALGGFTAPYLLASEGVVGSVAGKAERWNDTRAAAVDLESGAVADAAQKKRLPFAVLRVICDPADRPLPPAAVAALSGQGSIRLLHIAASVLTQPSQISSLMALSRDAVLARKALSRRVADLQTSGSLAPWISHGI